MDASDPIRPSKNSCGTGAVHIWVPALRRTANALRRVRDKSRPYFRTQITRTTDAFASADPPDALTPLALRKSRTVSAVTSTACAAGTPFGGPGHQHRLQQRDAGEPAVAIERRGAGETERRGRRQREIAAAADWRHRCLDAADRGAAALVLRIGNAGEVDAVLAGAAGEVQRLQSARAIDAQQREIVLLVLGDAVGIAKASDRDREAAVGDLAVGDDRAVVADDDAGAVFDGLARRRPGRCAPAGNGLNALDIAITTGSTVFSVA